MSTQYIVLAPEGIYGNEAFGPFKSLSDAAEWAKINMPRENWEAIELALPCATHP